MRRCRSSTSSARSSSRRELTHGGAPRVLVHNVIAPNFGRSPRAPRRDGGGRDDRQGRGVQGVHRVGPERSGLRARRPRDRAAGHPEGARSRREDRSSRTRACRSCASTPRTTGPTTWSRSRACSPTCTSSCSTAPGTRTTSKVRTTRTRRIGIDTFLRALDDHGVPPNDNVWVDVGTVWREVLRDPTTAAHTLGKLLKRVGDHRVLWGTDAIWYGSPQAQLQAFRAFTISDGVPGPRSAIRRSRDAVKAAGARPQRGASLPSRPRTRHAARSRAIRSPARAPTAAHLRADGVLPARVAPQRSDDAGARCCSGSRRPRPAGRPL